MRLPLILGMLAAFPLWAQTAQSSPISPSEVEFATGDGTPISFPSPVMTQLPVCYSEDSCSAVFAFDPQNRTRQIPVILDFPDGRVWRFDGPEAATQYRPRDFPVYETSQRLEWSWERLRLQVYRISYVDEAG